MKLDAKKFFDPSTFGGAVAVGVAVSLIVVIVLAVALAVFEPLRDATHDVLTFRVEVWRSVVILALGVGVVVAFYGAVVRPRRRSATGQQQATAWLSPFLERWGVRWIGARVWLYVEGPFCPDDETPLSRIDYREEEVFGIGPSQLGAPFNAWKGLEEESLDTFRCPTCERTFDLSGHGDMEHLLQEVAAASQARPRAQKPTPTR